MKSRFAFAAVLLACTAAVPAHAVGLAVSFSGLFDGTFGGQSFADARSTFTGIFDFDPAGPAFDGFIPLTSLTAVSGGQNFTVFDPSVFAILPSVGAFGFGGVEAPYFLFALPNDNPFGASIPVSYLGGGAAFETSAGTVTITDVTDATFSIALTGAVPEPATWGMLVLGFGLVGAGLRNRRTARVTA